MLANRVGDNHFECEHCHKVHKADSNSFISIQGNICVGLEGGLIGNNFMLPLKDAVAVRVGSKEVLRYTIFCRNQECMESLFRYLLCLTRLLVPSEASPEGTLDVGIRPLDTKVAMDSLFQGAVIERPTRCWHE